MKLYVKILTAAGVIEYGTFGFLSTLGFAVNPAFYGVAGIWLLGCRRPVKRYLLPPLFPATKCNNCHCVIALTARWTRGEEWTDSKERHALQVFSPKEFEIGSFNCPDCRSTIELQKVTVKRLDNWRIVDADVSSASLPTTGDLLLGTAKGTMPPRFTRAVRSSLNMQIGQPVYIDKKMFDKHVFIAGKTGKGKSSGLITMLIQLMKQGEGITVFDPDGDLAEDLLAHIPYERLEDVTYFNIQDLECPPPFNLLNESDSNDRNTLPGEMMKLFEKLYATSWGPHIARLLRLALNAAIEVNGSLEDVYDLLADSEKRHKIAAQLEDDKLREFWEDGILNPKVQAARYSLINKLEEIVHHPYIGPIVCSRSCMFDADEVIAKKRILIVNLNTGTEPGDTLKILGTMINKKMINAAYRQSRLEKEDRISHYMFIDEFADFVSSSFDWDKGLSKLRKYRFSFCFVTQYVDSLPDKIKNAIFGNVSTLIAFCLGDKDARALKDEMGCLSKRQLTRQKVRECRVCIDGEHGNMRTISLQKPLKHFAKTIKKRTQESVEAFRLAEQDVYHPQAEIDLEVKMIEQQAVRGELVLCEFA